MRTFEPWIGKHYLAKGIDGVRLLILGESHYGKPGDEYAEFTQDVITEWGQERRDPFFTKVAKLLLCPISNVWLSDSDRTEFWEKVAFYNFIQVFLPKARKRPTSEMWEAAKQPLLDVIAELRPHVILVLGSELRSYLPPLPDGLRVCCSDHPSFSGFTYEPTATELKALMTKAKRSS
jgi:hypothetical protein